MPDQTHPAEADPHAGATPDPVRKESMSDTVSFSEYQKAVAQATQRKHLIRDLQDKLKAAQDESSALKAERDDLSGKLATLQEEHEQLATEADAALTELETERDGWKTKYEAAPSEHLAELNRLKDDVRVGKHRSKLESIAKDIINPDALKDIWELSQYRAEGDEPDEAAITQLLTGLVESRRYLAKPAAIEADASQPAPGGAPKQAAVAPRRGPGLERGGQAPRAEDAAPAGTQAQPGKREADPFRIA